MATAYFTFNDKTGEWQVGKVSGEAATFVSWFNEDGQPTLEQLSSDVQVPVSLLEEAFAEELAKPREVPTAEPSEPAPEPEPQPEEAPAEEAAPEPEAEEKPKKRRRRGG